MKAKTVIKATFYGLVYFVISGLAPLLTKFVANIFDAIMDFEPRTVSWLLFVGATIGILVFIEKLTEERHPTGAGVAGILRYVVGLINITLYYNLLLHVGIFVPTALPNMGIAPTGFVLNINLVLSAVFFALYLAFLGLLLYGGYVLNFIRYIVQMGLGYKLTDE
ncbi:MAG: hypothetical protein ACTSRG_10185 [Candidatus Helarchaeota archaeon]